MSEYKQYKRKGLSEMRPYVSGEDMTGISVSDPDKSLPTLDGGMIARNPKNHDDKWYVAKKYFDDNLEEAGSTETKNLPYGVALEAAKQGKLIAREGWNGKGMFIFMRPGDELQIDMIVNKVKSLPESFKKYVDQVMDDNSNPGEKGLGTIKFTPYLCMKAADGSVVNGWLASQTDMLSSDWCILEY